MLAPDVPIAGIRFLLRVTISPRFWYWVGVVAGLVPMSWISGLFASRVLQERLTFCSCTPGDWPWSEANQSPVKLVKVLFVMLMLSSAASVGCPLTKTVE